MYLNKWNIKVRGDLNKQEYKWLSTQVCKTKAFSWGLWWHHELHRLSFSSLPVAQLLLGDQKAYLIKVLVCLTILTSTFFENPSTSKKY